MGRWTVLVVLVALLCLGAASASAIPVRDIAVSVRGNTATFSATIYSPPSAASCGASYLVGIYRNGDRYARRFGRLNVCRDVDRGSGWSRGEVTRRFSVARWPIDTYTVCWTAWQNLSSGRESTHTVCRPRKI